MELKPIIESIIAELISESSTIDSVLLKAQTIAYFLKDEELKKWVRCEQTGYGEEDSLPEYRKIRCVIKLNIQHGFNRVHNYDFPVDLVEEKFRDRLSHMPVHDSLVEVLNLSKKDGELKIIVPAFAYPILNKCIRGDIDGAWQKTTPTAMLSIVTKVKSKLLDFFLKLDEQMNMGIDFNQESNRKNISQIMNQTIYAGIVNTGNGSIETNNSTVIGGQSNNLVLDSALKEEIKSLLEQIKNIDIADKTEQQDVTECVNSIHHEVESADPQKSVIRKAFRALKSIPAIIAEKAVELGVEHVLAALI